MAAGLVAVAAAAAVVALSSGEDARAFAVPGSPASIVRTPEALWVAAPDSGTVWALDPATGRQDGPPLRTRGAPSRLAAGAESLWVIDGTRAEAIPVERGERRTFAPLGVGADATDAVLAGDAVWVLSSAEGVVRAFLPGAEKPVELPVGAGAVDLAAGGRWVVAAGAESGALARIDAASRQVVEPALALGGVPVAAAVDGDGAWVADAARGTVVPVDLRGGRVGAPVDVGRRPIAVAVDGDDVYVLCRGDRTLVHVEGGEVRSRRPAGADPVALALDAAHAWVADAGENAVLRYDR